MDNEINVELLLKMKVRGYRYYMHQAAPYGLYYFVDEQGRRSVLFTDFLDMQKVLEQVSIQEPKLTEEEERLFNQQYDQLIAEAPDEHKEIWESQRQYWKEAVAKVKAFPFWSDQAEYPLSILRRC